MSPQRKIYPLLLILMFLFSCVDKLDLSQIEDYNATPEYIASLTYFKVLPFQFFNQLGVQESERTDITDFRVFENDFLRKNLVKIDFFVEIKNEIDKDFTMQIEFLDNNNNLTHRFQDINVSANDLDYKFDETIEVSSNPNIKNTIKIKVTVKIDNPNPPLNPVDNSEFEFKSSAKIYIDTDD